MKPSKTKRKKLREKKRQKELIRKENLEALPKAFARLEKSIKSRNHK